MSYFGLTDMNTITYTRNETKMVFKGGRIIIISSAHAQYVEICRKKLYAPLTTSDPNVHCEH